MRRLVVLVLVVALVLLALAGPALAIVHATTPIVCAGAEDASGGSAGGVAAFTVLLGNPSNGPPMPAQGLANAGGVVCG
jgi:hypothetical protein